MMGYVVAKITATTVYDASHSQCWWVPDKSAVLDQVHRGTFVIHRYTYPQFPNIKHND
jgi:hypothetical protein